MLPSNMPTLSNSAYQISNAVPDAHEQLMVELLNRARQNPTAEIGLAGDGIASGLSSQPVEVLAPVPELDAASQDHSTDMMVNDYFSHYSQNGDSPFVRMQDAGYNYSWAGENISWSSVNTYTAAAITGHHNRLWASDGHQTNILNGNFNEVGIGYASGSSGNYLTQKFGSRSDVYLTGVVIDDADGDLFYDVGEGQGDVRITAYNDLIAVGTSTWTAGGYSLALPPGSYTVVFEGGDLDGHYVTQVTIGAQNVKLDVVEDRDAVQDPSSEDPGNGGNDGGNAGGTDNSGNDTLVGTRFDDTLDGGDGRDRIIADAGDDLIFGGAERDTVEAGAGMDTIDGGAGNDLLRGGSKDDVLSGGLGNDTLLGEADNDTVAGNAGNDRVNGNTGNDLLTGGIGNDTLWGQAGSDTLDGGAGSDVLKLGTEADVMIFDFDNANDGDVDRVRDMDFSEDVLILRGFKNYAETTVSSEAQLYGLGWNGLTVFESNDGSRTELVFDDGSTTAVIRLFGVADPLELA